MIVKNKYYEYYAIIVCVGHKQFLNLDIKEFLKNKNLLYMILKIYIKMIIT